MNYTINIYPVFKREFKRLNKRYQSLAEDLERLQNCSGTVECKLVLANNINASSIDDWEPLSIANSFDGNGYTISNLTSTQGAFLEVNERDDNTDIENLV